MDGDVTSGDMYEDGQHTHVLEDDSGRLALNFELKRCRVDARTIRNLVTGVVCAVRGSVQQNTGILNVVELSFAHTLSTTNLAQQQHFSKGPTQTHVLLVSGLECGNMDAKLSIQRDLLVDCITLLPDKASVAHVIVAGGSTTYDAMKGYTYSDAAAVNSNNSNNNNAKNKNKIDSWKHRNNLMAENRKQKMLFPMQCLDETFCTPLLSAGVPLTLVPSKSDPTNAQWPQQPLHPSLMPYSSLYYKNLYRGTNPCQIQMNASMLLGSDGASVRDVLKQIRLKADKKKKTKVASKDGDDDDAVVKRMREMDALELSLQWGHLSPTAPDSMISFPLMTTDSDASDPLCLDLNNNEASKDISSSSSLENLVYFMGNCDSYESRLVSVSAGGDAEVGTAARNARLICVPSFSKTSEVVLVDLESPTLESSVLKIDFSV